MKACLVKQPYILNATWESTRYPGPEKLLDMLPYRSQNFALMVGLETDIWVVPGVTEGVGIFGGYKRNPEDVDLMYGAHKTTPWEDVPWDEYDVVISYDPIIPAKIIRAYPRILWVYHEPSHRSGRSQRTAGPGGKPFGAYDLFWDDFMRPTSRLKRLPQSISFPYFAHPEFLRDVVKPTNEPAVFVDGRHTVHLNEPNKTLREWGAICGLPVRMAPGRVTGYKTRRKLLVSGEMLRCRQYLELVGSCKYKAIWRKKQVGGQASIEAASLGLIVIANSNGVYHKMLCHPSCLIPPGGPARVVFRRVQKIEADKQLQKDILLHQDRMLLEKFWKPGLMVLKEALRMKRNDAESSCWRMAGERN